MTTPSVPLSAAAPVLSEGLRHILVVGYGAVGAAVIRGLTAPQYHHRIVASVLVRPETLTTTEAYKAKRLNDIRTTGVNILVGDINDERQSLSALLNSAHIDTIISTVDNHQIRQQIALISAAKDAGVRWFLPSEFGFDYNEIGRGSGLPLIDVKLDVLDAIVANGLDYTLIVNAAFGEYAASPFFGVDIANNTITAPGSFQTKLTVTALVDIGNLTAAAVMSPATSRNQTVRLAGQTLTYEEMAVHLETVTGKPVKRNAVGLNELNAAIDADATNMVALYSRTLALQKGVYWDVSQSWNGKHLPQYRTQTFRDALCQKLQQHEDDDVTKRFIAQ